MLTKAKAVAGVKMIDAAITERYPHNTFIGFYQNKRKKHRDLKWDDLNIGFAEKLSGKLDRARIGHRLVRTPGRWGGNECVQIRLDVPLDFSLKLARGRPPRKPKVKPAVKFRRDREELRRRIRALRFGQIGHRLALSEALAAFRYM